MRVTTIPTEEDAQALATASSSVDGLRICRSSRRGERRGGRSSAVIHDHVVMVEYMFAVGAPPSTEVIVDNYIHDCVMCSDASQRTTLCYECAEVVEDGLGRLFTQITEAHQKVALARLRDYRRQRARDMDLRQEAEECRQQRRLLATRSREISGR
ncbi:hypothetical protein LCGC14_3027490 [marine sediment metagenome]|uniref:Uncharacterized protein n=1 Tax=marine sediment metagenome TaxID=412755 RepID=A0A0F8XGK1_9ZZZZ